MADSLYKVTCRGTIDDGARARITLEFPDGSWSGAALDPGQPFPSVAQGFAFAVEAESAETAIETVRDVVEGAGGHVDGFEAEPVAR